MRVKLTLKLHGLIARLRGEKFEIEANQQEVTQIAASGNAILPGRGILYWVEIIPTSDGGNARLYDNGSALGKTLSAGYAAKAPHSVINSYDPPKIYENGAYASITNAIVVVCYRPTARNLICAVSPWHTAHTVEFKCRTVVCRLGSKDIKSRLITRQNSTKSLVARATVAYVPGTLNLTSRVTVTYTDATSDLISRATVSVPTSSNLVCRVERIPIHATKALPCYLYADRTP